MPLNSSQLGQYFSKIALVAIFYTSVSWLTLLSIGVPLVAAPIWFPSGIALAALLLWGKQMWLAIFLSDLFLGWVQGLSWRLVLPSALGSILAAIAGVTLLQHSKFSSSFASVRDIMRLIFFGAILSPPINATLDLLAQVLSRKLMGEDFWQQWWIVCVGDGLGIVVMTPLLLRLAGKGGIELNKLSYLRQLEAAICFILLVGVSGAVFSNKFTSIRFPWMGLSNIQYLEYLPFPLIVWTALRFPKWGGIVANLVISSLMIVGVLRGVGPFIVQTPNAYQAILLLQIFLAIMISTSLFLSAAVLERQQAEKQLRQSLERDRVLTEQLQILNANLEDRVQERTLQLQEKIEEVEELYEMKNVFLQAVFHDLRTSIMGLSMLLKNLYSPSAEKISLSRSILERIIKSSDRQLTLINALSEEHFSESQLLIVQCQPLPFKDLVENFVENWQNLLQQNRATLTVSIPDRLPLVSGDHDRLISVFALLLDNALKHNPPGIHVTIAATLESDMVRCSFSDNGLGMNPQQCQHLFKLYVRSLHDRRLTGIGLGSYQCRQIIEAHGGKIGINSTPGLGSQFWFTLPLASI